MGGKTLGELLEQAHRCAKCRIHWRAVARRGTPRAPGHPVSFYLEDDPVLPDKCVLVCARAGSAPVQGA
jgi:hypothetical protein